MTLELRPKEVRVSQVGIWEKSISSSMDSTCKGPLVGGCLAVLRNSKEASVECGERREKWQEMSPSVGHRVARSHGVSQAMMRIFFGFFFFLWLLV